MVSIWNTVPGYNVCDEEMDYNAKRVACTLGNWIKIYNLEQGLQNEILETILIGHRGPVWKTTWAPPEFGTILASCSRDGKVIIWEKNDGMWGKYFVYDGHDSSSVNSVAFADHPFGLILACGSSDGSISILTQVPKPNDKKKFEVQRIMGAHQRGCNTVYWYPSAKTGYLYPVSDAEKAKKEVKRLASGGSDNLIKIWREEGDRWVEESKIEAHSDAVWDLAWAPLSGKRRNMIASVSRDRRVIVSNSEDFVTWSNYVFPVFEKFVWGVSWAAGADMIAVNGGSDNMSLWKRDKQNKWKKDDGLISHLLRKVTLWMLFNFDLGYALKVIFYIVLVIFIYFIL